MESRKGREGICVFAKWLFFFPFIIFLLGQGGKGGIGRIDKLEGWLEQKVSTVGGDSVNQDFTGPELNGMGFSMNRIVDGWLAAKK